jgi:hypothetical protein
LIKQEDTTMRSDFEEKLATTKVYFHKDQIGIIAGLARRDREACDLTLYLYWDGQPYFSTATCRADLGGMAECWGGRRPFTEAYEQAYETLASFIRNLGPIEKDIIGDAVIALAWIAAQLPPTDQPVLEIRITSKGRLQ